MKRYKSLFNEAAQYHLNYGDHFSELIVFEGTRPKQRGQGSRGQNKDARGRPIVGPWVLVSWDNTFIDVVAQGRNAADVVNNLARNKDWQWLLDYMDEINLMNMKKWIEDPTNVGYFYSITSLIDHVNHISSRGAFITTLY